MANLDIQQLLAKGSIQGPFFARKRTMKFIQCLIIKLATAARAVSSKVAGSEHQRLARRIVEIRNAGSPTDGVHTLYGIKISADDYFLMGCDNSCAERNFPEVPRDDRQDARWFTGGPGLHEVYSGGNSHGTLRNGVWEVDSFYTVLPRAEYQSSPEEVAWHYVRVKELRAAGIPQPERVRTLAAEAATKPWLS